MNSTIKLTAISLGLFIQIHLMAQVGVGPAPYCMPAYSQTPCNQPNASNNASNFINDFIDDFSTSGGTANITDNNTGCNSQTIGTDIVNYFHIACGTNKYLKVVPGQVITCNFKSGITYDQGFAVFVDWNNNALFDLPSELMCGTPGVPPAATAASAAFTVPAGQPTGTYRLRVRCAYATAGVTIDPCLQYGFGETQDYYVIIGGTCSVLPIELLSFDGLFKNNEVALNWKTASEINSDYFTIERSYDNEKFDLVSKVTAAGNSNSLRSYSVADRNAKRNGIIYYRLNQYDKFSSTENFSRTITVFTNETNIGFDVYPNPANTEMTLVMPDVLIGKTLSIGVYDNYGKKIIGSEPTINLGNTSFNFDINPLEKGTYFIRVLDNSGIVMRKILIKQ